MVIGKKAQVTKYIYLHLLNTVFLPFIFDMLNVSISSVVYIIFTNAQNISETIRLTYTGCT